MLLIRLLWWLVRLPWLLVRLPRRAARLVRTLLRRRWFRRLIAWLFMRQVRRSGWRATAGLLLSAGRRVLAASWRTTLGMFRLGRRVVALIGWVRAHTPRALGHRRRRALRARVIPALGSGRARPAAHPSRELTLKRRVARRRDVIRRSILASVGIDPNWRPARKPPAGRATR